LSEINLTITDIDLVSLYGEQNAHLNLIRAASPNINITARGNTIKLVGEKKETQKLKAKFEIMVRMIKENHELNTQVVEDLLNDNNPFEHKLSASDKNNVTIVHGKKGTPIKAKTVNQKKLVSASEKSDIVFAVGPAGTGKTYTAVALAVRALKNRVVKKIILTRPAVEAGENLGFLPGDLKDKVDPFLRPLYDALYDMLPADKIEHFIGNRTIEIAPLAFMRGRTLNDAFIILDEAQNCTSMQIKMFLTRLGPSAKCIITGDLSQIDLPRSVTSGLKMALKVLKDVNGISTIRLSAEDVVRHRLVKEIIVAYDKAEADRQARKEAEKTEQEQAKASNKPKTEEPSSSV
jgi:phosphate starvation-inducible PhoH-like protein